MMTSSNGNNFRVHGHLCGEFTGRRWIPRTNGHESGALMFDLRPNKRLSKQSWGWWFELELERENNLLEKSTSMYQQDSINIQKMTLIVRRLLLWYNMYRFRESHPVSTNRQCHNCHSVYRLHWLAHWKANFEYFLSSLSSGWFHRIEYEIHWSFCDRRATRAILDAIEPIMTSL